jgi:hypothetical protein
MQQENIKSINTVAVTEAWGAFFRDKVGTLKEEIEKDGWKDRESIYAMGLSEWQLRAALKKKKLERKHFIIFRSGMKRQVAFYRPKV